MCCTLASRTQNRNLCHHSMFWCCSLRQTVCNRCIGWHCKTRVYLFCNIQLHGCTQQWQWMSKQRNWYHHRRAQSNIVHHLSKYQQLLNKLNILGYRRSKKGYQRNNRRCRCRCHLPKNSRLSSQCTLHHHSSLHAPNKRPIPQHPRS